MREIDHISAPYRIVRSPSDSHENARPTGLVFADSGRISKMWKVNSYRLIYTLVAIMLTVPLILTVTTLGTAQAEIVGVTVIIAVILLGMPDRTPSGRHHAPGVVMLLVFALAVADVVWLFNMVGGMR